MNEQEANEFLRKAVAVLVEYSRIQVGYRAEFSGWVSETGELDRGAIEGEEHEGERFEAKNILFSCQVAEKMLSLTAGDLALKSQYANDLPEDLYGEYPEIIRKLEVLFGTSHRN